MPPILRTRGRLQEHCHHLIVGEILEAPQVYCVRRPWPRRTRRDSLLSLSLFLCLVYMCMCVCIHQTQNSPLLYTPVVISLRLVPTHTIKGL